MSMSTTGTIHDGAATRGAGGATLLRRVSPKAWFLIALIVFFAFYTDLAFDLEWRTNAGRIGPGYFPRLIGLLAILLTLVALVLDLRSDVHEVVDLEDEVGEAAEHLGRHPLLMALFVAVCAAFVSLLVVLGAVVATAVFLLVTLLMLDPRHRVRAVIVAIGVPILLYLAFETGLNAGLPGGIFETY